MMTYWSLNELERFGSVDIHPIMMDRVPTQFCFTLYVLHNSVTTHVSIVCFYTK